VGPQGGGIFEEGESIYLLLGIEKKILALSCP
jgi:hypothetical protein